MSPGVDALTLGQAWEARAARFLAARGIRIIERGYRCRLGEIDLVGVDGNVLVIIEVRARGRGGTAIETVSFRKQRRIINATRHFLMRNPKWFSRRIRFDVVAIDRIDSGKPEIQWVRNAFDAA
ncbi:MAG TPA: YraN family protein [Gammaproteobacteria bacterium]|nr:YraN family protein [Gammaproteobacteria bacterium]